MESLSVAGDVTASITAGGTAGAVSSGNVAGAETIGADRGLIVRPLTFVFTGSLPSVTSIPLVHVAAHKY